MKMNNKERITALLLTAAIIIGGAGCGNKKIDAVNTTPPAVSTSAATATPTEMNATLAMAPDITGLTKQIQNDKVVYISKEGNAYGLEANSYAGQFKKEVTVKGTEIGGVALVAKVAQKLLTDTLAQIPVGANKIKIIVPIAISQIDSSEEININQGTYPKVNASMIVVDYKGKVPLVSAIPGGNHFNSSPGAFPLYFIENDKEMTIQNPIAINTVRSTDRTTDTCYANYLTPAESAPSNLSANFNFGDKLNIDIGSPLVIYVLNQFDKHTVSIGPADLLTVDNHPVFIVANPTAGT